MTILLHGIVMLCKQSAENDVVIHAIRFAIIVCSSLVSLSISTVKLFK